MMLLIRSRLRDRGAAQWLDGGVVGLALAAVGAALIFSTVLGTSQGRFVAVAVNVAYPVGDFALLVFVVVAFSLSGWRPGRLWLLFGAGIVVTAVADIVYVYEVAKGTYVSGALLDAMWPLSMSLLALAAWQPAPSRAARRRRGAAHDRADAAGGRRRVGAARGRCVSSGHPAGGRARRGRACCWRRCARR